MNKRIYLLLSVGFMLIALLGALSLYQGIKIKELEIQTKDQRIMLDQIYFEVYGTQFTDDYKPSENDNFFPMFNSRIDQAENLGKTLFFEVYGDAFLVSVQCQKVDTHTVHLGLYPTHVIPLVGAFHLDDFCTKISELQGAIRARKKTC